MRFGHPGVEQTRQLMYASQSLCPLACLGVPGLHIYSYCVTVDISAERRYPMSPKDWFDVINGIIANVIAAAALAIAVKRRPKHKK